MPNPNNARKKPRAQRNSVTCREQELSPAALSASCDAIGSQEFAEIPLGRDGILTTASPATVINSEDGPELVAMQDVDGANTVVLTVEGSSIDNP